MISNFSTDEKSSQQRPHVRGQLEMNSVYWHLKLVETSQSQDFLRVTQLMDGTLKLSVESIHVDDSEWGEICSDLGVGCVVGLLLTIMEGEDERVLVGAFDVGCIDGNDDGVRLEDIDGNDDVIEMGPTEGRCEVKSVHRPHVPGQ